VTMQVIGQMLWMQQGMCTMHDEVRTKVN
jgi:hypothetical protein